MFKRSVFSRQSELRLFVQCDHSAYDALVHRYRLFHQVFQFTCLRQATSIAELIHAFDGQFVQVLAGELWTVDQPISYSSRRPARPYSRRRRLAVQPQLPLRYCFIHGNDQVQLANLGPYNQLNHILPPFLFSFTANASQSHLPLPRSHRAAAPSRFLPLPPLAPC
jgi:hypothetical protein